MARKFLGTSAVLLAAVVTLQAQQVQQTPSEPTPSQGDDRFKFRTGIALVNVNATVTDSSGRFVAGLSKEDFTVYEDDVLQTVTHFGSDRVPVSLGIVLDTSGSMEGDKIRAARQALQQFLFELSDPQDEFFLYRFSEDPVLLQGWTSDREAISRALSRISPSGDTAMYDAVAEAIPLASQGRNTKKAIVVISDGNDTSSRTGDRELRQLIRESEVLVYAIGIDGNGESTSPPPQRPRLPQPQPPIPRFPIPIPQPFPPRRPGGLRPIQWQLPQWPPQPTQRNNRNNDRVNVVALRDITDDSGGRTEIVRDARDLNPATANIADELSKQYYLGYPANSKKDGRWHAIRVEVRKGAYHVRARRGYVAS